MKALFLALVTVFFAANLFAGDMLTLNVKGMTCGGCEKSIQSAVTKVHGVKSCTANYKTGKVEITPLENMTIDKAQVEKAISEAGDYKVVTKK